MSEKNHVVKIVNACFFRLELSILFVQSMKSEGGMKPCTSELNANEIDMIVIAFSKELIYKL